MQNNDDKTIFKESNFFSVIRRKTDCLSKLKDLYLSDILNNYAICKKLSLDWDVFTDYHKSVLDIGHVPDGYKQIDFGKAEDILRKEIDEIFNFAFGEKVKWEYDNPIWYNVYGSGQHADIHDHKGSSCSLVYFLQYDKKVHTPTLFVNEYDGKASKIDVEEGDLIMFDSEAPHYVEPNESDFPRITLAMNISVDDQ